MDLYGVIGYPIKHSLSPAMHNAAFKACGINAEYKQFEVKPEELEDFLLNRKEVVGFNITIPHKVRAREIMEKKFPLNKNVNISQQDLYYVKLSGAINTVKRNGNKIEYRNTDPIGFYRSLEEDMKFDTKRKSVLLIGCGGAGRAVIAALSWTNMYINKIYIYDKSEKAVASTKEHFFKLDKVWQDIFRNKVEFISGKQISDKIKNCHLLVNASPVGMEDEDDTTVIDKELLHEGLSVYDLVYNRETQLIKDAKLKGLNARGGKGMLWNQGAFSFSFWTGVPSAKVTGVMKEALDKAMKL